MVEAATEDRPEQTILLSEWLGADVDLPYLFKVLSVRTALSVQAHPDRVRAEFRLESRSCPFACPSGFLMSFDCARQSLSTSVFCGCGC